MLFRTLKSSGKRVYGWNPDRPDHRDKVYKLQLIPAALPPMVDLRAGCSPVEDQGELGSCTGNALVGALEFLELKDKIPFKDLSRLFVYYNERVIEHSVSSDSGAAIRDGIKTLKAQGVCSELNWPYNAAKFAKRPSIMCYAEGLQHQITSYSRITNLSSMKTCLYQGFPFVFGFTVYESFESQEVANTGIVPMPRLNEQCLGGHAVLAVGYNDASQSIIVRNSWGPNWGQKGYFMLPYQYIGNVNLADDMWTIRRGENM